MTRISHIVFDIGNVLLRWDPELIYLERIPDPQERRWFLQEVCSPKWNIERDLGKVSGIAEKSAKRMEAAFSGASSAAQ